MTIRIRELFQRNFYQGHCRKNFAERELPRRIFAFCSAFPVGAMLCADDLLTEDVDECVAGTHNCRDAVMTCVNRPGTFACQCRDGFHLDQLTMTCRGMSSSSSSSPSSFLLSTRRSLKQQQHEKPEK